MVSRYWILLVAFAPFVSAFTATSQTHQSTRSTNGFALKEAAIADDTSQDALFSESNDRDVNKSNHRRHLLLATTATAMGIFGTTTTPAEAATTSGTTSSSSKEILNNLLIQLRTVPTFCLVNAEGIPYMIIKQQERMAKGYAFTSMEGAVIVLNDAQRTAKEKGYFDIWESATVVTVPADVAVRMALQKRQRIPTRGSGTALDSLVDIIPTTENREAAMMIDKRGFQDQGKTPLFYVEGLTTATASGDDSSAMPLFLQKSALIKEWQQQPPGESLPPIQAIDLTYMFEAALRGYVDKIPNKGNVVFVPDPEQVQIAQKLRSEGLTMYKFDKMVV